MSKLEKIRKEIIKAETKVDELQSEIIALDEQSLELSSLGNYRESVKVNKKKRSKQDLLANILKVIDNLKLAARQADLEENRKDVTTIIKEMDNTIPKELALILREFKRGFNSIRIAEERLRVLRATYNDMSWKAIQTDRESADKFLRIYEHFDWSFGEAEMARWLSESLGLLKDPKKHTGLLGKIDDQLKLKTRQIDDVLRATKGRK